MAVIPPSLWAYRWPILLGYGGFILLNIALRIYWSSTRQRRVTTHGSERWATRCQLRQASAFNREGFVLGQAYGRYLRSPSEQNVVLFAPPGEGKTSGPVAASLLARSQASAIVLDLSGELLDRTRRFREQLGPVYVWAPADLTTDQLNPWDLVAWGTPHEVEHVQRLSSHVVSSVGQRTSSGAAHYERVADTVLALAGLYVGHSHTPPSCSFAELLDFFSRADKKALAIIRGMATHWHRSIRRGAGRLLQTPSKIADDWGATQEWLTRWEDPKLARSTAATTIPWQAMQSSDAPMTLYIRVSSDDARGRLSRLLRMNYDLMSFRLSARDPSAHRRELDWVVDDMGVIGDFPPIEDIATEKRKYGFRLLCAFQSPTQAWHESGRYAGLLNSCGCWVIYRQNDPDSAHYLERKLGDTTVAERTERVTSGWWRRRTTGVQTHRRPLMTAGELQSMRPDAVVVCVRHLKVQAQRVNIYRDRHFRQRVGGA